MKVLATGLAAALAGLICVSVAHAQRQPVKWDPSMPTPGFQPGPASDAVKPGLFFTDPPTIHNLGFRWYIEGDSNRNASVAVDYRRKGETAWRPAQPMLRVHHEVANQAYGAWRCGNLFAGSVLFLEPGTDYEVRLTMSDPDGGAPPPRVVAASTRQEPARAQGERTLRVAASGADTAPPGAMSLAEAVKAARPGDVILLGPGVHPGPVVLATSGQPDKPIVFRGAQPGKAILQGPDMNATLIDISAASHVHFEDLVLRRARFAIKGGDKGKPGASWIVIRGCRVEDVISGFWTMSENSANWLVADNVLIGTNPSWYPRPEKYMSPSHTGVNVYGQGHVVCHNNITRFSDSLAIANFGPPVDDLEKHCVNIDFYNNDLSWAQDDNIEADYGCHNIRVYRNRCATAHTPLSVQPSYGGPIYLIRNEAYGFTGAAYKLHNFCTGIVAFHNTTCGAGAGFSCFNRWQNGMFRNNLIMGGSGLAISTGSITPYTTLDYNGYSRNSAEGFIRWNDGKARREYATLEEFAKGAGHEKHGRELDYDVFARASRPKRGETYDPGHWDVTLRPGSAAVDAGQALANINDGFAGDAPDLGCHELGRPTPHYGPR